MLHVHKNIVDLHPAVSIAQKFNHEKTIISLLSFLLMNLATVKLTAQIAINDIGATPRPSTMLDVRTSSSTTARGVLFTGRYGYLPTVPDLDSGTRFMFYPGKNAFRVGTAIGPEWNNVNVGNHSVAFGYGTTARGDLSFAAGNKARAHGYKSLSIGDETSAAGISSVAFGSHTLAFGNYATSFGTNTRATGHVSIAMGESSEATGMLSTAMGNRTIADGDLSTTIGQHTRSDSYASFVMGQYNSFFLDSDHSHWITTDPLLVLGNGSPTVRSNAFVVYKNGNIDINGFTRLGNIPGDAPTVKMKKIIGTGPAVGGSLNVAHGLPNASKILSVQIFMQYGASPVATKTLPPNYTLSTGFEYQYEINGTNILITNKSGNSDNIGSKAFRMLITYEQ